MKTPLLTLLLTGLGTFVGVMADDEVTTPATPALKADMSTSVTDSSYNPDPGAGLKSAAEEPFYTPPPGTPADYGQEREPLLDTPRDSLASVPLIRKNWQNRDYTTPPGGYPAGTEGGLNRWTLGIPTFQRYVADEHESPYADPGVSFPGGPEIWDPYKQSILKGDSPVIGQNIFLMLTATNFTSYEARDIPTPAGVSTARSSESEFFGQGDQQEVDEFATFSVDLFQGETAFQPVTWLIHLQPVYNFNYSAVQENGVLSVDPRGSNSQGDNNGGFTNNSGNGNNSNSGGLNSGNDPGSLGPGNPGGGFEHVGAGKLGSVYETRTKDFASLQEAFVEVHLTDFSDNYDFCSLRLGNQPFNSDFRGFIFDDTNLGMRFFGNLDNNKYQYNVAAFDMREKDTYSELNTFDGRHQYIFDANLFRQDFFFKGYTAQINFLTDLDDADEHYDRTGNLVRPADIGGPIQPHDIRAYYIGLNGDGHIGRVNVTNSFYEVFGRDTLNGIAGQPTNINAQMGALELSYDQDWIRYKASFFYASGDRRPADNHATGFDSVVDNPNFVGGPFSYYVRQGFIFGDTAVNFKQGESLLPDLRSSKDEGQANYVNPGVFIYGLGTEMSLFPTLKLFLNANYIRMADTETVNYALHTANVTPLIGYDLSGGIIYRPLLTDNIIISAGLGSLIPGEGYKAIYRTNTIPVPGYPSPEAGHVDAFLYSGFASVTLTY
jgi:hypothetical protein